MPTITKLSALEILDSRGRPTVQATCSLASGAVGTASVPSGASTGAAEALELRDCDPHRYRGLGCRKAVRHINGDIHGAIAGRSFECQDQLDNALIALDGTANKSHMGANAVLGVSLAFARAAAAERNIPLYQYFADMAELPVRTLPRPTINLFSGGKHAGEQVVIQDVLVVPTAAATMSDALAMTYDIYQSAAELAWRKYGMRALTADEGGLAPPFASAEAMLSDAVKTISDAGYKAGLDVHIAVDIASSQFYRDGAYWFAEEALDSELMIRRLNHWVATYPIISIEDGLAEDDWEHWPLLYEAIHLSALVLGDDLLCTNPKRIQQAIETRSANALLLKVNQVGTLTEALQSFRLARAAGWHVTASARSGETEDNWLADLAVGWGANHIKIGSITQSERLAKYNRLLAIEAELSLPLCE